MSVRLGRSIKIHLYWAMKNCGGDPDVLQQMALNIPNHYKVNAISITVLTPNFSCRVIILTAMPRLPVIWLPIYQVVITNKKTEEELLRCIKSTYVFKNAGAFCRVMIEILLPKKYTCCHVVSGHVHGRVIQPPAADLLVQTHPLF